MKKIIYIATVAKKHICQFHIPYLKWFHEHGYEVHVCAGNDFDERDDMNIPYCDKFYDVCFSRSPLSRDNIKAYRQLKKLLYENDYDLIHCHTPIASAIARLAAKKLRKKGTTVLYTSHGFHFFRGAPKSSIIYYLAEKFLVPYTDGIITVNDEDYEAAKKLCKRKKCDVYYVPGMGVDTETIKNTVVDKAELKKSLGIPAEAFTLLSVSEQNYNKNLTTTLKAFARIDSPVMYYLICGIGDMLESHKALAKELGIADRVVFTGYRYDIFEIVHIADVFLFPSLREGFGVACIEAMSAGVPIIASDIRGVRGYAVNGKNSILLEPSDIDGFAKAIERLESDHALREKMSRNALGSVAPFDLKKSLGAMEKIYGKYIDIEVKADENVVRA